MNAARVVLWPCESLKQGNLLMPPSYRLFGMGQHGGRFSREVLAEVVLTEKVHNHHAAGGFLTKSLGQE